MANVLFIFGQLSDGDVRWLAREGRRVTLAAGDVLIREGVAVDTVYIVLEGQLAVVRGAEERMVARLGVGEIVGEMSFVDSRPPSATVRAESAALVFAIPSDRLRRGLEENPAFAARMYRALAMSLSDRVRRATASEQGLDRDRAAELDESVLDHVERAGARFDALRRGQLDG